MVYMSKPIKVSDDTYQRLKAVADKNYRSLGKQIDYFLDATGVQGDIGKATVAQPVRQATESRGLSGSTLEKNASDASVKVDDLFSEKPIKITTPEQMTGEQPCCQNEIQPCKHWVWDSATGEGYKNTLSGRFMEVEG